MASTTNNLGLHKPADGETGWGEAVAENFDTIDTAIEDLDNATEKTSRKGQPGGYAALNGSGRVPAEQLGSGAAGTTTFLRGDGSWQTVSTSGGGGTGGVSQSDVDTTVATHSADTTDVHGIADTSVLATTTTVSSAVETHRTDTTDVHGIADTAALATTTAVNTAVETHRTDTTDVHGIANTANLVLTDDPRLAKKESVAGPVVRLYLGATYAPTSGSVQKLTLNTQEMLSGTDLTASTTNNNITVNVAGLYLLTGEISFLNGTSGARTGIFRKNGVTQREFGATGTSVRIAGATVLPLAVNDVIDMAVYTTGTPSVEGASFKDTGLTVTRLA